MWDDGENVRPLSPEQVGVREEAREQYRKWALLEEIPRERNQEKCG